MRKRRWLRAAIAAVLLLFAARWGVSLALAGGWARRSLVARVSASFGRPVEVGRFGFGFSMLGGPRLVADRITVSEDPRFGAEYFLRAEQLSVSLSWAALLRGRIEFGTLSFSQPSLNLVRDADGRWNVESWLPPPAAVLPGATRAAAGGEPVRLARLEIDGGRINFKRGTEKLPFALVDVSGRVERDAAGRWSIDLAAHPMRAPVAMQDAGTMWLRGNVGGTSARLRPATLDLAWEQASLADILRLALGSDRGLRGTVSAEFTASLADAPGAAANDGGGMWNVRGNVRLTGMHRWDLSARDSDPAANLRLAAQWRTGEPRVELSELVVEAPHSRVGGSGAFDWSHGPSPTVKLVAGRIDFEDVLAWRRAFLRSGADDLAIEGIVGIDVALAGWPLHIEQAALGSSGIVLRTAALPGPLRVGRVQTTFHNQTLELAPVSVELPGAASRPAARNAATPPASPAGALRVEGALGPLRPGEQLRDWPYRLSASGKTERVQDLVALAAAFGGPAAETWAATGGATLELRWTGALRHGSSAASGTVALRDLKISSALLNQPLEIASAGVELRPGDRRVKIAAADGFGAQWKGTLERRAPDRAWTFDLAADRLDVAELDRWLGPRARPGLLERMLPFTSSAAPAAGQAALANALAAAEAHGHLHVDEVLLAPVRIEKLDAQVNLAGRTLSVRDAQAELGGGHLTGDLDADLSADAHYTFRGQMDRVNLAELAEPAKIPAHVAGTASGEISLAAQGIGRGPLLATLVGEGTVRLANVTVRDWAVAEGSDAAASDASDAERRFSAGKASFRLTGGNIVLDQLLLTDRAEQLDIAGTIDFSRRVNLRVSDAHPPASRGAAAPSPGLDPEGERRAWNIAGTLDAPLLSRPTRVAAGVPANHATQGPRP